MKTRFGATELRTLFGALRDAAEYGRQPVRAEKAIQSADRERARYSGAAVSRHLKQKLRRYEALLAGQLKRREARALQRMAIAADKFAGLLRQRVEELEPVRDALKERQSIISLTWKRVRGGG